MTIHEFTIQGIGSNCGGPAIRLGIVRITLDSDAAEMIDQALSDVYADRGSRGTEDMMLALALNGLPLAIVHRREVAEVTP